MTGIVSPMQQDPLVQQDPLAAMPAYNRLSLRAVIVPPGQDPSAALAAAGIVDPISLPVAFTSTAEEAARLLGAGATPHLAAVLEQGGDGPAGRHAMPVETDATMSGSTDSGDGRPGTRGPGGQP